MLLLVWWWKANLVHPYNYQALLEDKKQTLLECHEARPILTEFFWCVMSPRLSTGSLNFQDIRLCTVFLQLMILFTAKFTRVLGLVGMKVILLSGEVEGVEWSQCRRVCRPVNSRWFRFYIAAILGLFNCMVSWFLVLLLAFAAFYLELSSLGFILRTAVHIWNCELSNVLGSLYSSGICRCTLVIVACSVVSSAHGL